MSLLGTMTVALTIAPGARAADPDPARPGVVFLDCGETVGNEPEELVDFKLGNNLICTTGDALTLDPAADGITIDLDGHRISGDGGGGEDGIVFPPGADNIEVKNGVVVGFDHGALVQGAGNTLRNMFFVDNNGDSVQISGDANTLTESTSVRGGNVFLIETAQANTIIASRFIDDSVVASATDLTAIQDNVFYAGSVNLAVGTDGSVGNQIVGNTFNAPATAAVTISGDTSDSNVIDGNTVIGAGTRGIDYNDGDSAQITNNVVRASAQDGIELRGSATGATITGNTSSANTDDGIGIGAQATSAQIADNVTNENGDNGIEAAAGSAPDIDNNTTNFNGFKNGLADFDGLGISSPDGTTSSDNTADGNDVVDPTASQCNDAALCSAPGAPSPAPPLFPCGHTFTVATTFVLRHPLDCATGDALKIGASDVVLDLTVHRVSGGSTVWTDASIAVATPGTARVTVKNGVVADSGNGVRMADSTKNRIDGVLAARSAGAGFALYRTNENVITGSQSLDNTGDGVVILNGDLNRVQQSFFGGNTANGIGLVKPSSDPAIDDRSSKNVLVSNEIIANEGNGVSLANANATQVTGNTVSGHGGSGSLVAGSVVGSPDTRLTTNTFRGNEGAGVLVDGNGAAGGAGSRKAKLVSNVVTANQRGVVIQDPDSTGPVLSKNTMNTNDQSGAEIEAGVTGVVFVRNKARFNGVHGLFLDGSTAARVVKNVGDSNGFFADNTAAPLLGDDIGLAISAPPGTPGCGNKGTANDDPDQIEPKKLKKRCR